MQGIQDSVTRYLCPVIRSHCTPEIDESCIKHYGVRWFEYLNRYREIDRVQLRTSTNETFTLDKYAVSFDESVLSEKTLEAIGSGAPSRAHKKNMSIQEQMMTSGTQRQKDDLFLDALATSLQQDIPEPSGITLESGKDELPDADTETPWFDRFASAMLQRRERSSFETFEWPVAQVLAVSTAHPDALNALAVLWESTDPSQANKFAPWFSTDDHPRYIVLVHDLAQDPSDDAWDSAQQLYMTIRKTYGLQVALLPLFRAEQDDLKAMNVFIKELIVQNVLPHLDRFILTEHDKYNASRKSFGTRLFSVVGRRLANDGTSPQITSSSASYNPSLNAIPWGVPEMRHRRLADLAFMMHDFRLAQTIYEPLIKYFANEGAPSHYASVVRMHALSSFLVMVCNTGHLNPGRRRHVLTVGATQAASEFHISLGQVSQKYFANADAWPLVAFHSMRSALLLNNLVYQLDLLSVVPRVMGSIGPQDDLFQAMYLEQSARAFLRLSSFRNYALYRILSAVAYERAGFKKLSHRSYLLAAPVLSAPCPETKSLLKNKDSIWINAKSHVLETIARQSHNSGDSETALAALFTLLRDSAMIGHSDPRLLESQFNDLAAAAQSLPLDMLESLELELTLAPRGLSYLDSTVQKSKQSHGSAPLVQQTLRCKDRLPFAAHLSDVELAALCGFEALDPPLVQDIDQFYNEATPLVPLVSSPYALQVSAGEPFFLKLVLKNPWTVSVTLTQVKLSFSPSDFVRSCDCANEITLAPREERMIPVKITSCDQVYGTLKIDDIFFLLNGVLPLRNNLAAKGKRLTRSVSDKKSASYGPDIPLSVTLVSPRAYVHVEYSAVSLPPYVSGQLVPAVISLTNTGSAPASNFNVLSLIEHAPALTLLPTAHETLVDAKSSALNFVSEISKTPTTFVFESNSLGECARASTIDAGLAPGDSLHVPACLWLTFAPGTVNLAQYLFYEDGTSWAATPFEIRLQVKQGLASQVSSLPSLDATSFARDTQAVLILDNKTSHPMTCSDARIVSSSCILEAQVPNAGTISPNALSTHVLEVSGRHPLAQVVAETQTLSEWVSKIIQSASTGSMPSFSPAGHWPSLFTPQTIYDELLVRAQAAAKLQTLRAVIPAQLVHQAPIFECATSLLASQWSAGDREGIAVVPEMELLPHAGLLLTVLKNAHNDAMLEESRHLQNALISRLMQSPWCLQDQPISVYIDAPQTCTREQLSLITIRLHNRSLCSVKCSVNLGTESSPYSDTLLWIERLPPLSTRSLDATIWVIVPGTVDVGSFTLEVSSNESQWTWTCPKRLVHVI